LFNVNLTILLLYSRREQVTIVNKTSCEQKGGNGQKFRLVQENNGQKFRLVQEK